MQELSRNEPYDLNGIQRVPEAQIAAQPSLDIKPGEGVKQTEAFDEVMPLCGAVDADGASPVTTIDEGSELWVDDDEPPESDVVLQELKAQTIAAYGEERVGSWLAAHERFNIPVEIDQPDGTVEEDPDYHTKAFLAEVPEYMSTAEQAGMGPEEADDLLRHTLNAVRQAEMHPSEHTVHLLKRALSHVAEINQTADPETLDSFVRQNPDDLKEIVTLAASQDALADNLCAYEAATRAGLRPSQAARLVQNHLESYKSVAAPHTQYSKEFRRALEMFGTNVVPPPLVEDAMKLISAVDLPDRHLAYQELCARTMTAIAYGVSPADYIETVCSLGGPDGFLPFASMNMAIDDKHRPESNIGHLLSADPSSAEARDVYFAKRDGPLVHTNFPYQVAKSMGEGIQDLRSLVGASVERGDIIADGAWIFDPDTSTWYALAGRVDESVGWGTHYFFTTYPGHLCDQPSFFYIRPQADYGGVEDLGFLPSGVDFINMYYLLMRDVPTRFYMCHAVGITEICCPPEMSDTLNRMPEIFDAMVDELYEQIDDPDIEGQIRAMGEFAFVEWYMEMLNSTLPDGFRLRLHAYGSDLR